MAANSLVTEVGVVGLLMAIALGVVAWGWPQSLRSVPRAAVMGFVLGGAFHLACEFTGLNRMYCRTGHACAYHAHDHN